MRARGTKIILEDGDLAKIIESGKLSGGYKGHNYLVTSPPSPILGVSEEIHNATADQLVESKKEVEDLKATIAENMIVNINNLDRINELEQMAKKLQSAGKKYKALYAKAKKEDQNTIPIDEHQDLMGAKVQTHNEILATLEDDQAKAVEKLEDEADEMTAEIRDLKGGLENAQNDLNECSDKKEEHFNLLGDCEEKLVKAENDLADCEN